MSVNFVAVRYLHVNQTSLDKCSLEEAVLRGWSYFDAKSFHFPSSYNLVELVSVGWKQGARVRVKRIAPDKALGYINKLHTGGWIDDDAYHTAYTAVDNLLSLPKAKLSERLEWEVVPYSFRLPEAGV